MKSFFIRSVVGLLFLSVVGVSQVEGQQANPEIEKAKQLAKQLLDVKQNEFAPLQKELDQTTTGFYAQQSGQSEIIRALEKSAEEGKLEETRRSLVQLKHRIVALEQIEKHLVALADDASLKAGFIKEAEDKKEKITMEQRIAVKPFNEKRMAIYKKHKDASEEFAGLVEKCFSKNGEHDLTKGTERKYHSYDSAYARSSTSFYDEHGQKVSVQVSLVQTYQPDKKLGNFLKKYPLSRKSSFGGYTFHVGKSEVKVSSRIREWTQEQMEAAVSDLVDFDKLEAMVAGE